MRSILSPMSTAEITPAARRGRPCGVCALSAEQRTQLETQLASGWSISRISRQLWAPGRDSIRHHIRSYHLPAAIQGEVERVTGLDTTTLLARVGDIATRARTSAQEAEEAGDRAGVLKAGDAELRALGILSASGVHSEADMELNAAFRDIARAVYLTARRGERDAVETIAAELYEAGRAEIAEDILDQIPNSRNEEVGAR